MLFSLFFFPIFSFNLESTKEESKDVSSKAPSKENNEQTDSPIISPSPLINTHIEIPTRKSSQNDDQEMFVNKNIDNFKPKPKKVSQSSPSVFYRRKLSLSDGKDSSDNQSQSKNNPLSKSPHFHKAKIHHFEEIASYSYSYESISLSILFFLLLVIIAIYYPSHFRKLFSFIL